MEPLVFAAAVAVVVCGWETAAEIIRDVRTDGSWAVVKEYLAVWRVRALQHRQRLPRHRARKMLYYRWT